MCYFPRRAAGTNNARLAGLLRSLSAYYARDPAALFLVRVAQGLVHMGKGLLSLTPHHTDRQLLSGARRCHGCYNVDCWLRHERHLCP